jgi:hypothetical protein
MATNPITKRAYQVSKSIRLKKKPKAQKVQKKVPTSTRYCLTCKRKRSFKLVPLIGHSRCTCCGGSYSAREDPNKNRRVWVLIKGVGIIEEKKLREAKDGKDKKKPG